MFPCPLVLLSWLDDGACIETGRAHFEKVETTINVLIRVTVNTFVKSQSLTTEKVKLQFPGEKLFDFIE